MESKDNPPKPFVFPVMKKTIEDLFTKSKITKDDIEAFQDKYWEQLVPNFSQALKLLDIHGVPRHNILWSINDRLMDAIKARVDSKPDDCDQRKCQKLWQKLIKTGIVYIHHPYMRSLIMQVLGKMNSIKERHVNLIVDNKYLYDDAPLPVLRHIWVAHPHKFQEELDKVVATFQSTWSSAILDALSMSIMSTATTTADLVPILYWPPRRRRRDPSIVRIVEMIGEGQVLYDKTISILREECTKHEKSAFSLLGQQIKGGVTTGNSSVDETDEPSAKRSRHRTSSREKLPETQSPNSNSNPSIPYIPLAFMPNQPSFASATLCTLRFDLLMSLNEAKIDRLCVPDRIHRFVWCLDACVRNRRIDQRHASELAYHLQLQRRRWAKEAAAAAVANEKQEAVHEESERCRGKNAKSSKSGRKRSPSNSAAEKNCDAGETGSRLCDANLLERDMHMACRDPWVVYTICTSLIRYVLHGLYEDKVPRDIPEVHLLVHLLVLGLGDDLVPHYCLQSSKSKETHSGGSGKRSTPSSSSSMSASSSDDPVLNCPAKALISYILPAVAQLQVSTWKAQVAEEIITASNSVWSTGVEVSGGTVSTSSQRQSSSSSSSHESSRESINPPPPPPLVWQKRIKDATQCTSISIPPGYLAHPIGYLILQYHCLFCLERNELATLRALLKLAVTLAQTRGSRASSSGGGSSGSSGSHNKPTTPNPSSSAASSSSSSSTAAAAAATTPTKVHHHHQPDIPVYNKYGLSVVFRWRPEVLQIALLMPGPTSSSGIVSAGASSIAGGASTYPSSSDNVSELASPAPTVLSEREKIVNTLARHCILTPTGTATAATTTPAAVNDSNLLYESTGSQAGGGGISASGAASGSYKSTNPRVLAALDALRRDIERCHNSLALPLTPTNLVGIKPGGYSSSSSSSSSNNLFTNFSSFQMPDAWISPSPRSPQSSSKYSRPTVDSIQSSANSSGYSTSYSSSSSSSSYGLHLPIGTPLTNPGLMGATPSLSNLHVGQSQVMTSRKPSQPPPPPLNPGEFRTPLSPNPFHQQKSSHNSRFGPDSSYASCPSPAVHRSSTSQEMMMIIPRSPSPPS
uniref:Negative elongation factor B n=1 Tax=Trichobilharzia regenti TaxID=157069 RepID=A0AA85IYK7_TRIRE|nr:unnamed protein product [Trichobilharzia regenti]